MADGIIIEAACNWEMVFEGGVPSANPFIFARVKYENGEPVLGLRRASFRVRNLGYDGELFSIDRVREISEDPLFGLLPGTYMLKLHAKPPYSGQFVIALNVRKRRSPKTPQLFHTGQTLVSVVKLYDSFSGTDT